MKCKLQTDSVHKLNEKFIECPNIRQADTREQLAALVEYKMNIYFSNCRQNHKSSSVISNMRPHLIHTVLQKPIAQEWEQKSCPAVCRFYLCHNITGWRKKTHIKYFPCTFQKQ